MDNDKSPGFCLILVCQFGPFPMPQRELSQSRPDQLTHSKTPN